MRVKSSPPFLTASGETIMPARSTNVARKGAEGPLSVTFTVAGSTTSTAVTSLSSALRGDEAVFRPRSRLNFTASALTSVPSWNFTPFLR